MAIHTYKYIFIYIYIYNLVLSLDLNPSPQNFITFHLHLLIKLLKKKKSSNSTQLDHFPLYLPVSKLRLKRTHGCLISFLLTLFFYFTLFIMASPLTCNLLFGRVISKLLHRFLSAPLEYSGHILSLGISEVCFNSPVWPPPFVYIKLQYF